MTPLAITMLAMARMPPGALAQTPSTAENPQAALVVISPFVSMPNVGAGHHPKPYFTAQQIAENLTFAEAGRVGGTDNRGNLIWTYAALDLLDSTKVEVRSLMEKKEKSTPIAKRTVLFFIAPNILAGNVCDESCWAWYHAEIKKHSQAMVFGLGIQIHVGSGWDVEAMMRETLPPHQAEAMRSAASIASTIWVRGELTAHVLKNAGVANVDPIGCVSQLLHRNPRLGHILSAGFEHVRKVFPKTADGRGCGNDVKFIDTLGQNCSRWHPGTGHNCTLPPNGTGTMAGYSDQEMDRVRTHCPFACGTCRGRQLRIAMAMPTVLPPGTSAKAKENQETLVRAMNTLLAQNKESVVIAQTKYDSSLLWSENLGQIRHFYDVRKWREFLGGTGASATGFGHDRPFDFFIGGRIHGSMAAISVGVPTVIIPNDYRILELAEVMRLPIIHELDRTNPGTRVEQFFAPTFDPDAFDAHRVDVARKLVAHFAEEGVSLNPEVAELASGVQINGQAAGTGGNIGIGVETRPHLQSSSAREIK